MSDYDYNNLGEGQSKSYADVWLKIEAQVRADRAELLVGLDTWLQLGLISQAQVRKIARNHLSCPLPIRQVATSKAIEETAIANSVLAPATSNTWQRVWQSFLDELSIRWLLFLGIFLVVVSSGVLAASQWQNFADYGQYSILLLYSLSFGGIGFWTGKQEGLRLTAQTLKAIATLLIPINFWAISHLGLLSKPMGLGIVALGVITLTTTGYLAFPKQGKNVAGGLFLLLSYLHLGWQIPNLPLLTIYSGIGIVIGLHYQKFLSGRKYPFVDLLYVLTAWLLLLTRELIPTFDSLPNYSLAIAPFAWLLCTIYLSQVRQTKLVALQHKSIALTNSLLGKVIKIIALILFILTWWISLQAGIRQSPLFFWQNVAISSLGIQLFYQRLTLYWHKRDLTAIFLFGLQTLYLSKELIPDSFRNQALDLSVEISNSSYFPESVLGVSLFPYLILFIFIASWLYRQQKNKLGLWAEYLTLYLGIAFTCLSWTNPTWRSLNLLFSTLALGYVAYIRLPMRSSLVYATHLLGLITAVNAIAVIFPDLSTSWWGSIFIALMGVNWGIYLARMHSLPTPMSQLINRSCWYAGLLLSALSYTCFLADGSSPWGLVWFISPVMATLIGKYTRKISQRRLATVISCLALILSQILLYDLGIIQIIGLAVATVLMLANAFNLRRPSITVIHLGMAIALFASLFNLFVALSFANYQPWLLIGCIAILLLYQLRLALLKTSNTPKFGYISQRSAFGILGVGREIKNFKLVNNYIKAADYCAIALIVLELLILSLVYFLLPNSAIDGRFFFYLLTTGLLATTIVWRYGSKPNNLVLYTLTWLISIFASALVRLISSSTLILATNNILLGFTALVAVVLLAQSHTPWAELDLVFVPLIYAVLGILWRFSDFNAYTGLLTLGAAIILLSIQPQGQIGRIIKYLGFAAISAGIYELVIYQMQSGDGGSVADALTILSLVAAAIAFSYRIIVYWYATKASTTIFNLSLSKLTLIAHLHWAISSILKIIAAGIAIENNTPRLTLVSIATSFCLGAYAVIQGRDNNNNNQSSKSNPEGDDSVKHNDWWVYVGLVEIAATLIYSRLIITKLSLFDPWRIIFSCAVALLIYQIPWQSFGWRSTPWQRTAIAIPALMALVTAEDISYFSLVITALFYLRIAYAQRNIRWSYISLGLCTWLSLRVVEEYSLESIWIAGITSLSILYIAQFDSYLQSQRQQRHYLRLVGSSIFCLTALFQQPGIVAGMIAFGFILFGLGLRIRALLFTGTITLVLTVLHQLIILVFTYSFLKWVVGLLAGISSIAIAAGFEKQRDRLDHKLKTYQTQLQNWQ